MLANRTTLAIPAFVDLFTLHLPGRGLSTDRRKSGFRSTHSARSLRPVPKGNLGLRRYLRRDFTFALAITAKGGATVISTRMNTITKPNMISPTFFGFSVEQEQGWRASKMICHHPLGCRNARKVADLDCSLS
jgi:hypothetical protein